ncbi:MAG TPA: penicillin-binding protein activator [Longimicrobiaceae bacterium]|nr:penicillin-binding protein activator [Longimicrobiaceae bacterium]
MQSSPTLRLAALALVLGAAACSSGSDAPDAQRNLRAGKGGAGAELVIGAAWPWEARKAVLYWQGMELAQEEINAAGGVLGRPLRILRADDQEDVDQGRLIAQEFGKNPEVVAVIGHLQSYVTVPAAAVYDLSGTVLVSATATTSELTSRGYKRVFRTIFTDADMGRQLADHALRQGHRKVVIYYSRDEYGRGLANAFEERALAAGGQVLDRRSYDPSAASNPLAAAQTVDAWENLGPDAVFIAGQDEPAALLAAELRKRGITAPILGGDALATPTYLQAGEAVAGTVIATPFHPGTPTPEVQRFTAAFRQKYGKDPDVGAALGYDAVRVLAHAIGQAGDPAPEKIADAMHAVRGWRGVTGTFSFDAAGNLVDMPIQKVVVRDGGFHPLAGDAAQR